MRGKNSHGKHCHDGTRAGKETAPLRPPLVYLVAIVLSLLGVLDTAYLSYLHSFAGPGCSEYFGCSEVLKSSFSVVGGIPLSWLGLAFFLSVLFAQLFLLGSRSSALRKRIDTSVKIGLFTASACSGILLSIQVWAIQALCPFCVLSSIVTFSLTAIHWRSSLATEHRGYPRSALASGTMAAIGLAALMGVLTQNRAWSSEISVTAAQAEALANRDASEEAQVTLTVFSDYECPDCQGIDQVLRHLRRFYSEEQLAIQHRHFPLKGHPKAFEAAVAAEAAALQGKFRLYHWLLFDLAAPLDVSGFRTRARIAGLDVERFEIDRQSERLRERVRESKDQAIAAGITGTPTLLLNGKELTGQIDTSILRERIDALREHK